MSAYQSKLNPGAQYYHKLYGTQIVKNFRPNASKTSLLKGNDVSFPEFISYVVHQHENNEGMDEHWKPQHKLCHPCMIRYKYIGKYENIEADFERVLRYGFAVSYQDVKILMNFNNTYSDEEVRDFFKAIPPRHMTQLRDLYKFDFELFNYSKTLPGAQWWQIV